MHGLSVCASLNSVRSFDRSCHRVIRSDGAVGGYQGGLSMTRTLLEMDGIVFPDSGHVATRSFFYEGQVHVSQVHA
ncbi:MAG: MGMT family protein [Syntrophales bacterium]